MPPPFDLVVRRGTVVTATEQRQDCDIGVIAGKIAALGAGLARGGEEIDARDLLVLPGGDAPSSSVAVREFFHRAD